MRATKSLGNDLWHEELRRHDREVGRGGISGGGRRRMKLYELVGRVVGRRAARADM